MRIEHIAMYVNNLETARDFFVKYLGGHSNDGYYESCIVGIEGNQIHLIMENSIFLIQQNT